MDGTVGWRSDGGRMAVGCAVGWRGTRLDGVVVEGRQGRQGRMVSELIHVAKQFMSHSSSVFFLA